MNCCNDGGDCRQGRDCPAHAKRESKPLPSDLPTWPDQSRPASRAWYSPALQVLAAVIMLVISAVAPLAKRAGWMA